MNRQLNEFLDQYTEDIKSQFYKQDEEAEVNVPTSQSSTEFKVCELLLLLIAPFIFVSYSLM